MFKCWEELKRKNQVIMDVFEEFYGNSISSCNQWDLMLTSRRQSWDLIAIKKAYTILILLYFACWKKGDRDSFHDISKKVISKARMWH